MEDAEEWIKNNIDDNTRRVDTCDPFLIDSLKRIGFKVKTIKMWPKDMPSCFKTIMVKD